MDPQQGVRKRRRKRLGKRSAFPTFPHPRLLLKLERMSRNKVEKMSRNFTKTGLEWETTALDKNFK
jgi:hypothetical protein